MCVLTPKVGVGLRPGRVLVSADHRTLQKRCAALKTEGHWQHGSVTAEELPGYFSGHLLFLGKVHSFEMRAVGRKGSLLIKLFSFLFLFLREVAVIFKFSFSFSPPPLPRF